MKLQLDEKLVKKKKRLALSRRRWSFCTLIALLNFECWINPQF